MAQEAITKFALHISEKDFLERLWDRSTFISAKLLWTRFSQDLSPFYPLLALFFVCIMTAFASLSLLNWRRKQLDVSSENLRMVAAASEFNDTVISRIRNRIGPYIPPWWYQPHLGTLIPFGRDALINYERQLFSSDEATFAVDWYPFRPPKYQSDSLNERAAHKIILFLPGLGLTSKNKFCKQFVLEVEKKGYFTAVVNARGLDVPLKTAKFWHPAMCADALTTLEHISVQYPTAAVFMIGYSAGTNILKKILLGRTVFGASAGGAETMWAGVGADSRRVTDTTIKVSGAMCVCVNQNYPLARTNLESTLEGRIFSFLMTLAHKELIKSNANVLNNDASKAPALKKVLSARSLSEFDAAACIDLYGFRSEEHYYESLSNLDLDRLTVPTLLMQPADDPLFQGRLDKLLAVEEWTRNANVIYVEPKYGNHFGFYEGPLLQAFSNEHSYTYPAKIALEFFETILEERVKERECRGM